MNKMLCDDEEFNKVVSIERTDSQTGIDDTSIDNEESQVEETAGISDISTTDTAPLVPAPLLPPKHLFYLEPCMFLIHFAHSLSGGVYTNLLLYQSCTAVFHYSENDCQPLLGLINSTNTSQHIEDEVQPYVSKIQMVNILIDSIIPAAISLFIGPWSDKYGRRPVLLVTFTASVIGYIIATTLVIVCSILSLNPWIFIITTLPSIFVGGSCTMMTVVYCFISDKAPVPVRAIRMYMNDAAMGIGKMLGSLASGYLFSATNMITVYAIAALLTLLSLVYIIFCAKESLKQEYIQPGSKLRNFLRFDLVVDLVHTATANRPNFKRTIIWLTIAALIIVNFIVEGESNVFYLYLRKQFDIDVKQFSTYNALSSVIEIVGAIVGMNVFRRVFNLSMASMALIALACSVLECTIHAAAKHWWEIYLGTGVGFFASMTSALLLTILATITPSTEVGKIYALTTALQTIAPLGSAPLYTTVYDATMDFYPGLFNIISAVLYFLCFTLVAVIVSIKISTGSNAGLQRLQISQ